jgi:hypothetical protein
VIEAARKDPRWKQFQRRMGHVSGSESPIVSLGASMSWGDLVEWFKDTSPPGDACCVDGRWMPDCPDTHPGKAKCHPNIIERVKRFVHLAGTEQFVDEYADELLRHRSERGIECSGAPTEEEDKAVLGAMMAPLGLSREEEDAVYTAASRGVGTLLDLYAPGAGQGATQASDALSMLITGRKMAPHAAPAKAAAPKASKTDKALLSATAALQKERAKVAKFNTWMREHPVRSFLVSDEIRNISGVESSGPIDAIVPAHNEESTVANVARALIQSGAFGRVIVVDDGSTDNTAEQAKLGGAEVVRLENQVHDILHHAHAQLEYTYMPGNFTHTSLHQKLVEEAHRISREGLES